MTKKIVLGKDISPRAMKYEDSLDYKLQKLFYRGGQSNMTRAHSDHGVSPLTIAIGGGIVLVLFTAWAYWMNDWKSKHPDD